MGHPEWLYYLFAVAMLAVAFYNLTLLALSLKTADVVGRDVDLAHIFMGVAMSGMFVVNWAFGPNEFWEVVFFGLMVWFVVRSIASIQRFGLHVPHEVIHALMSFAMLLMYWYPMGASGTSSMSMSGASSSHAILDPGISLILAFVFFGSAIFTLASPNKGASHHGTHNRARTFSYVDTDGRASSATPAEVSPHPSIGFAAALTRPQLEDISHVVMCLGMGFMLILML
jgi:hypothetical protein